MELLMDKKEVIIKDAKSVGGSIQKFRRRRQQRAAVAKSKTRIQVQPKMGEGFTKRKKKYA